MSCDAPISTPARVGRAWRDSGVTPLMIELPAGSFLMGENNADKFANDTERPVHEVDFSTGRALGCFPVTVGEFRHFCPGHSSEDADELPVVHVNWHEALSYCDWLTERTGRIYRLPSEAEWEFACRAGSHGTAFACGNEMTPFVANYLYDENGVRVGAGRRTPVGSYPPNPFGFHDFHGNVCEWVEDTWHPGYLRAPGDGRAWVEAGGTRRVVRGGSWDYLPRLLRSSWRDWHLADQRADNIGFRVATSDLKNSRAA